jgi:hypothetical protein
MATPEMYLAHEDWSPRFEKTFYTVKMDGCELLKSLPATTTTNPSIGGNTNFPAYFYNVKIFCGHESQIVQRRFSQFKWLYEQLRMIETDEAEPLIFPPGSWCQSQNNAFAQNRVERLQDFLRDALVRRGVAKHDAVVRFLELDSFP